MNNSKLLGAGGYGITITLPNPKEAIKLLYSTEECAALRYEATIQNKISRILSNVIHVPQVSEVFSYATTWESKQYLCGIVMERIPMHPDFGLCIEKYIPLERLLTQKGTVGFYGDIYVPKEGDRGYPEFIQAYLRGI